MKQIFKSTRYSVSIVALLILLIGSGCFVDDAFECERGNGNDVTEDFDVRDFSGVRLTIDATVFVTQGDEQTVTITGQSNVIDEVRLRVRDDVLIIDTDRCIRDYNQLDIFITIPTIHSLSLSGSGQIIGENTFLIDDIDLSVSGSGEMDLGLEGDDIMGAISGSGEVQLEGTADVLDFRLSGSGDLKAFDLLANRAELIISGSGDMEVNVQDFLDVRISGSGDVFYIGNPEIDTRVSGSGNVVDAN